MKCGAKGPLLTIALLPVLTGCRTCQPRPSTMPRVEIQGHRGCRGLRPENTMAGFRHAIQLGVDVLELDLGLTRDGVLAVLHDPELNPTICDGVDRLSRRAEGRAEGPPRAGAERPVSLRVRDLTFAQIRELDCGARQNPSYPRQKPMKGERIPRLEQVLDLMAKHPRLGANIEIKTFSHSDERRALTFPPERFAELLVPMILQRKLLDRVTVQSFDARALQAVKRVGNGRITLAVLADRREDFEPLTRLIRPRVLSPRHTELQRQDIARFRSRGLRVIPWTVNDPTRMRELISWGVDGIITDRPDLLRRVLGRAPQ